MVEVVSAGGKKIGLFWASKISQRDSGRSIIEGFSRGGVRLALS